MLKSRHLNISASQSIIGFEKVGSGQWPVWDRYLTIEGKRAYHIGNICDTCAFFFERLEGANQSISATTVVERLRVGLTMLDTTLIQSIQKILPVGEYRVSLLDMMPHLVAPGTEDDYFVREQVDLWGVEPFWGLPHYPKTEYYRTRSIALEPGQHLFEFMIPMFPHTWLKPETITRYKHQFAHGEQPTALVLSVLDVKQPADWSDDSMITEHWCLAHYMLDGHHKTFAASQSKKHIKVLSFLAVNESIATTAQIDRAITSIIN